TFVFFLRTAQLIKIITATTPDNNPTVANPRAKSYPSEKPNFSNVPAIPAAVPCPPSKAISIKAPAIGGKPKNEFKINTQTNSPPTYCPNPIVQPKESWGAANPQILDRLGNVLPRKRVANTTLIIKSGSTLHTSVTFSGIIPFTK